MIKNNLHFLFLRYLKKYAPRSLKYLYFNTVSKRIKNTETTLLTKRRFLIKLDLSELIDYWIFMEGSYENEWIEFLENKVRGKVFIDAGANIGIYSLALSKYADRIISFEPVNHNFARLKENIEINKFKNIEIHKKALDVKVGTKKIFINQNSSGWNSFYYHQSDTTEKVECISLDHLLNTGKIGRIDCIKIDVEGAELDVLNGGKKLIDKFKPDILVEFNKSLYDTIHKNISDLYKFFNERQYKAFRLINGNLVEIDRGYLDHIYIENIWFERTQREKPPSRIKKHKNI